MSPGCCQASSSSKKGIHETTRNFTNPPFGNATEFLCAASALFPSPDTCL
jgi:hypothetical protein